MNSETIERVAYHEAGHAVAAIRYKIELDSVTIAPEGIALGYVEHHFDGLPWLRDDRDKIEAQALVALAGAACDAHHFGRGRSVEWNDEGYRHDVGEAMYLLQSLAEHDDEGAAYLEWIKERAMSLAAMPLFVEAADALASASMEKRELTGEEARELYRSSVEAIGAGFAWEDPEGCRAAIAINRRNAED